MPIFTSSVETFVNKLRLKTEVLNKMQADRITMVVKSDPIICQYGENYFKKLPGHLENIENFVSNEIREMGELLVILQGRFQIKTMLEALNSENYEKHVNAVKILSDYKNETKTFNVSMAVHMGTNLKTICNAAKSLLLRGDPMLPVEGRIFQLKTIKEFRTLITKRWEYNFSSPLPKRI